MGSISKELREKQLEKTVADLAAVKTSLKEKGLSDKDAAKNAVFRQLKAAVSRARKRIHAIDNAAAHVATMKEKDTKAEKVAREKKAAPVAASPAAPKNKNAGKKKK